MAAPIGNNFAVSRKNKKNKKTVQWEVFSKYCLEGGLKKFQEELDKLSGKDYIIAFSNLLEYHAPKLARQETLVSGEVTHIVVNKTIIRKNV